MKTRKTENVRVIIWALLASGVIPPQLADWLQAVSANPEGLANLTTAAMAVGNLTWWGYERLLGSDDKEKDDSL